MKKPKRNFFKPDDISDCEERDRVTSMQQREYLLKTVGLLQTVSWEICAVNNVSNFIGVITLKNSIFRPT